MVRNLCAAALLTLGCIFSVPAQLHRVTRMPEIDKSNVQKDYYENENGYWMAAEAGAAYSCRLFGSNFGFTEVDVTGGYRFSEYFRAGLGLAARLYFDNNAVRKNDSPWAMPVFVNFRGNFIPTQYRNVVPFYSIDTGATFRDGFMIRPSVGLRIGQQRNAFVVSAGYLGQNLKIEDSHAPSKGKEKFVSFVTLRLGYEF